MLLDDVQTFCSDEDDVGLQWDRLIGQADADRIQCLADRLRSQEVYQLAHNPDRNSLVPYQRRRAHV
jgi:hypothetical protein